LVTGQLAKQALCESAAQQEKVQFSVKALPVPVAALLTPNRIAQELKHEDLTGYDLVIVPGMVRGELSIVEETVKVPVIKGTRYAADVPVLLGVLENVKLSKIEAADFILSEYLRCRNTAMLEEAEHQDRSIAGKPWNVVIGRGEGNRVPIGRDFPMRVIAEILDAPILREEEVLRKAKYYAENGARIVDVGMLAGEARPDDVRRIVTLLRRKLSVPISIDTLNAEEIEAGLLSGADMILSLNSQNVDKIKCPRGSEETAVVVIPERADVGQQLSQSRSIKERVASLEENIKKATEAGFKKIIADLIMDPLVFPGLVTSIVASRSFSEQNPNTPLMVGVGNITELIDADSVGVNATLAGIAQELGVALLLTTEGSAKTRGAVKELVTACQMTYLAARRNTPPKDLGLSLLMLKEKRRRELPYEDAIEKRNKRLQVLRAKRGPEPRTDPKGLFKINVDRDRNQIIVSHFKEGTEVADIIVRGDEPLAIRDTLNKAGLVSTLEHAYYLGAEVEKAFIASQVGRGYYQDDELFTGD